MPNVVVNRVTITGPEEDLKAFRKKHITRDKKTRKHSMDYETIIPLPPGVETGWDASMYWGTKWNAGELPYFKKKPGVIDMRIMSAWAAPDPIFVAMAEQWPSLKFRIRSIEEFMDFGIDAELQAPDTDYDYLRPRPGQAAQFAELYKASTGDPFPISLEEFEAELKAAEQERGDRWLDWDEMQTSALEYVILSILGVGAYLAIRGVAES